MFGSCDQMLLSSHTADLLEVGLDEVGRGCLAGPVVAAAVILPKDYSHPVLNDSKKLSAKQRRVVGADIIKNALEYAVAEVSVAKIDEINILNASFLAMHKALDQLTLDPQLLLIDGNRFRNYKNKTHLCVVKGDGKYMSIAAASILAKNYRDELMAKLAKDFPYYGWEKNAGYPTKIHREGISTKGSCIWHRKSFKLLPNQLEIALT
jgi:ribonuclease HII